MQIQQKCHADGCVFRFEESHADTAEMPRSPCLRRDCPGHCLHFKDLRQADAGRKEPHAAVPVIRHQTAAVTVLLPDFSALQTASV